jgi:hypothetical protein
MYSPSVTTLPQRVLLTASVVVLLLTGCSSADSVDVVEPEPTQSTVSTPAPSATPEPIVDGGARDMANGAASVNSDGSVAYVVAEGDVGGIICERFGISGQQLQYEDLRGGINCYAYLYPGDVLNLSTAREGE